MTYVIEIRGLDRLEAEMRSAPTRAQRHLALALRYSAVYTQRIERMEAPVDKGILRAGVTLQLRSDSAVVFPIAKYAAAVNSGTGIYGPSKRRIYPKHGRVLAWKSGGKMHYARSVAGQRANPFIDRTYQRVQPRIQAYYETAIESILSGK